MGWREDHADWAEVVLADTHELVGWITNIPGNELRKSAHVEREILTCDNVIVESRSLTVCTRQWTVTRDEIVKMSSEDFADMVADMTAIYADRYNDISNGQFVYTWNTVYVTAGEFEWLFDLDVFDPIDTETDNDTKNDVTLNWIAGTSVICGPSVRITSIDDALFGSTYTSAVTDDESSSLTAESLATIIGDLTARGLTVSPSGFELFRIKSPPYEAKAEEPFRFGPLSVRFSPLLKDDEFGLIKGPTS